MGSLRPSGGFSHTCVASDLPLRELVAFPVWLPVWALSGKQKCTFANFPTNLVAKHFTKEHKHARVIGSRFFAHRLLASESSWVFAPSVPDEGHDVSSKTLLRQTSAFSHNNTRPPDCYKWRRTGLLLLRSA